MNPWLRGISPNGSITDVALDRIIHDLAILDDYPTGRTLLLTHFRAFREVCQEAHAVSILCEEHYANRHGWLRINTNPLELRLGPIGHYRDTFNKCVRDVYIHSWPDPHVKSSDSEDDHLESDPTVQIIHLCQQLPNLARIHVKAGSTSIFRSLAGDEYTRRSLTSAIFDKFSVPGSKPPKELDQFDRFIRSQFPRLLQEPVLRGHGVCFNLQDVADTPPSHTLL